MTNPDDNSNKPGRSGAWIVVGVLLIAAAMAGGNFVFQYLSTRDAMAFWGDETAQLFVGESTLTVARLEPTAKESLGSNEVDESETRRLAIGAQEYLIVDSRDATDAGGNLHFRRALLQKRLFDWENSPATIPSDGSVNWRYAVTFSQEQDRVTLALSEDMLTIAPVASGSHASSTDVAPLQMLNVIPNDQGLSPLRSFLEAQFREGPTGKSREF